MKTDEIPFTFVTAIVLAGALIAIVSPHKPDAIASAPVAKALAAPAVTAAASDVAPTESATAGEFEVTE